MAPPYTEVELQPYVEFAARHFGRSQSSLHLERVPLKGGLESNGVYLVRVASRRGENPRRIGQFVAKHGSSAPDPEARIYEVLSDGAERVAPEVLGMDTVDGRRILYLEWVRPWLRWPWRQVEHAALVLEQAARLHMKVEPDAATRSDDWYESSLAERAATTVDISEYAVRSGYAIPQLRRVLPALRRIVRDLPEIRERMLSSEYGQVLLHGDLHPGNVIVRRRRRRPQALLIDWGRARVGSPFEDVCSWLQSLGFWEPRARQVHDTLLCRYLGVRGLSGGIDRSVRKQYWLAGASNALAGALTYHIWLATDAKRPRAARESSRQAAARWLRVVLRADEYWRAIK